MPDETTTDPRAAVLRAAGHPEAANLLDALNRLDPKSDPVAQDPEPPATSDPREAEGATLLQAMRDAGVLDGSVSGGPLLGGDR